MQETIQKLLTAGKGILAADESTKTITKRFLALGLTSTPELNKKYREMLFTTPELENYISGVILYDESVRQGLNKILEAKGIIPGIKVDGGLEPFNGTEEQVTKGLDGLDARLKEYSQMGLKFTKWRGVFKITDKYPSKDFYEENLTRMAKFAKISQQNNMVPIVEPEVLLDGNHTTTRCSETLDETLKKLFEKLKIEDVDIKNIIVKTSMALPGPESGVKALPLEVANATLRALRRSVPPEVPGIVFLSGGQDSWDAMDHLDKIEDLAVSDPWKISFSYSRALQDEPQKVWSGKDENVAAAQTVFLGKLKEVNLARQGRL
ncbi:MAG TPA: class I fructose-bisphosphate aldolase [Patescibacteria group bacterium]|nr:class I fructose-bisphosphate aldolase [Patescibacteria group bacterium]